LGAVIQIGRFGLYDDLASEPLTTSYSSLKTEVCVPPQPAALLQLPTPRSEPWHSRAVLAPDGD